VLRQTKATEKPRQPLCGKSDTGGRASAEVAKSPANRSKASFGMTVTLRRDDGREQSFRIVGEDQADPSRGTVSYVRRWPGPFRLTGPERLLRSPAAKPSYWTCGRRPCGSDRIIRFDAQRQTRNRCRMFMSSRGQGPTRGEPDRGLCSGGPCGPRARHLPNTAGSNRLVQKEWPCSAGRACAAPGRQKRNRITAGGVSVTFSRNRARKRFVLWWPASTATNLSVRVPRSRPFVA
jgi:Transcription elongation factor, GreA/GreB, C-term